MIVFGNTRVWHHHLAKGPVIHWELWVCLSANVIICEQSAKWWQTEASWFNRSCCIIMIFIRFIRFIRFTNELRWLSHDTHSRLITTFVVTFKSHIWTKIFSQIASLRLWLLTEPRSPCILPQTLVHWAYCSTHSIHNYSSPSQR